MEVGPEFFGVVAGVLPTLAVSLFLVRRTGMSKKEERQPKTQLIDADLGTRLMVFGTILLILASVAFFSYAEIVALLALGAGGGSETDMTFLVVAVGVMLFFLASAATTDSAQYMRDRLQDATAFIAFGIFFLLIAGAFAHLGYKISGLDLSWVYGWMG